MRPSNAIKAALLDPRYVTTLQEMVTPELWNESWTAIATETVGSFVEDEAEHEFEIGIFLKKVDAVVNAMKTAGLATASSTEEMLNFWRNFSIPHCHLFQTAARFYLSIPAGSAGSEGTSPQTTLDVTKLRTLLGDDTLE